jgi:hypothetical protein
VAATVTRFYLGRTSLPILTGVCEHRLGPGIIPSIPVNAAERGPDGGCRTMRQGTAKSDDPSSSCSLDQAYERAIDDLVGPPRHEARAVPARSASEQGAGAAVVRGSIPTVRTCPSVTRAIVCRRDARCSMAPTDGDGEERGWPNCLRKAFVLCCMALAAILFVGSTPASWRAHLGDPHHQPDSSALTPDVARYDRNFPVRPIEEIQVGDRVAGTNPLREQAEEVEPVPASWRKLSLRMRPENGHPLWIDLLRPLAWIQANEIQVGKTTFLDLPEMGAVGAAEVTDIGPCPRISGGKGTIVTGKFTHQSDGSNVVRLRLAAQSEPTGVTRNHPYWSYDRSEFVKVGELRIGESVDTEFGARSVVSVEPFTYNGLLHNLETAEHVYRVGALGALVHNSCFTAPYNPTTGGHHILLQSAYAPGIMAKALAIPNWQLQALGLKHMGKASITTAQRLVVERMVKAGAVNSNKLQARIARRALVRSGLPPQDAKIVVAEAIKEAESRGAMAPAYMPWH